MDTEIVVTKTTTEVADAVETAPETRRFMLYNTMSHEDIERLVMDVALVKPEAGIVNPETFMLDTLKGGAIYTVVPLDDHTVRTLANLKRALETAKSPLDSFQAAFSRMDDLLNSVELLFGEIEYYRVTTGDQLEWLIQPTNDETKEPPKVKYTMLDGMLMDAVKKAMEDGQL